MSRDSIFKLNYPKSFLRLSLTGFLLIALLLGGTLVKTVLLLEDLAKQSEQATDQAVQLTQALQRLDESAVTLERTARQYVLLEDSSLLTAYRQADVAALKTVEAIQTLQPSAVILKDLHEWHVQQVTIAGLLLQTQRLDQEEKTDLFGHFSVLARLNQQLLSESQQLIDQRLSKMRRNISHQKKELTLMVLGVMGFAVLLALGFGVLISRPVRQLEQAILQLGDNKLEGVIEIDGPADLTHLGQRLDWLRLRLRDLEAEKTRFMHHMSHELKTPLAAIREGVELLGDEVVGPLSAGQRQVARILRQNSLVMQKQIEDLLNYNAAHYATSQLVLENTALDRLLLDILQTYQLQLRTRELQQDLQIEPIALICDAEKMRTVFDNLISNAIKFSPQAGTITLRLRREDEWAVFDCIDQGPGVKEHEQDRVFEPFFQGTFQPPSHVQGSGLGLSIAREYVELHQGTIMVIARPTDKQASLTTGAHFQVTLLCPTEE